MTEQSTDFAAGSRRVLFPYFRAGTLGSVERYILQNIAALHQAQQYQVLVACPPGTAFHARLQELGLQICELPNAHGPDWATRQALAHIIRRERPGVVHLHGGLSSALFFKRLGCRVVLTADGSENRGEARRSSRLARLIDGWLGKLPRLNAKASWEQADALVFPSRAEQQRLLGQGLLPLNVLTEVIHSSLAVADFRERMRQYPELRYQPGEAADCCAPRRSMADPGTRYVSFIGRLEAEKNPFAFVALAERLGGQAAFNGLFFLMAGRGGLGEDVCIRISQSPVKGRIHNVGYSDEVPYLLSVSDLIVFPGICSRFGAGVLEAMAAGTPLVAYADGVIPELLAGLAFEPCLAAPGDFGQLVEKAEALLAMSAEERHRLSHQLQARAELFEPALNARRLAAIYDRLL